MTLEASTSQISRHSLRCTEPVFVQSKGAQLSVRDSGGDSEPIVFLSGGPGMPDYLEEIAKLVPGRRVVTYDQRGTGASTVIDGDYSTHAHVADLEQLRENLGAERFHLFGHSWGGMLAQLYATAHVGSVASLFLCSPTPGVGLWPRAPAACSLATSESVSSFASADASGRKLQVGLGLPRIQPGQHQPLYATNIKLSQRSPHTIASTSATTPQKRPLVT